MGGAVIMRLGREVVGPAYWPTSRWLVEGAGPDTPTTGGPQLLGIHRIPIQLAGYWCLAT